MDTQHTNDPYGSGSCDLYDPYGGSPAGDGGYDPYGGNPAGNGGYDPYGGSPAGNGGYDPYGGTMYGTAGADDTGMSPADAWFDPSAGAEGGQSASGVSGTGDPLPGSSAPGAPTPGASEGKGRIRMLSDAELAAFSGQMALILKSGISAFEGISIMREDAASEDDRAILNRIYSEMESSGFFASALKAAGVYPDYYVNMVEIGERTGNLDTVMRSLETHYDREAAIKKSTRNAVFYPLILAAMMFVVIVVLLVKVMPVFNDVFLGLGAEMTGLPAVLMNLGGVIRNSAVGLVIVLCVVILLIYLATRTGKGHAVVKKLGRHIPSVRSSNQAIASCRFADAMSMTLSAGLTPEESVELAETLNEDPDFRVRLETCRKDMADGKRFSDCLHDSGIFSGVYARLVSIGGKTGMMDEVMAQIADMYQEEIDARLNNRLAVIEPALVIVVSAVIGVILLSVMFPLLGIMSSI